MTPLQHLKCQALTGAPMSGPELNVGHDRCVVHFNTHAVSGTLINDFICAAKADALVAFVG